MINNEQLIEILTWYKKQGIKSIDKAIKFTEKNSLSYMFPKKSIEFKGSSIINDLIHRKLRINSDDLITVGIKKITYSSKLNTGTIHYVDGKKIKLRGDEAVFKLVNLSVYELFNVLVH